MKAEREASAHKMCKPLKSAFSDLLGGLEDPFNSTHLNQRSSFVQCPLDCYLELEFGVSEYLRVSSVSWN